MQGHTDYVRSAACSPVTPTSWITGAVPWSCAAWCLLAVHHNDEPTGGMLSCIGNTRETEHLVCCKRLGYETLAAGAG